jgi:hypothetical protein
MACKLIVAAGSKYVEVIRNPTDGVWVPVSEPMTAEADMPVYYAVNVDVHADGEWTGVVILNDGRKVSVLA